MNKLQEKRSLVNMALALGQKPDPVLLEEIQRLEAIENRIKKNIAEDLNEIFSQTTISEVQVDAVLENIAKIEEPVLITRIAVPESNTDIQVEVPDVATQVANSIDRQMASEGTVVRPEAQMPAPTAALEQKLKYLENWVSRIAATGPGSGEVNFRWLDDVNRATINKDWYLTYNPTSKKFEFVDTRVSIEAFDRSSSIALTSIPTLLRPNSTTNAKNMTYDSSTGIFTFLTQCEVSLAISLNAIASAGGQRVYQYAERNTGSGWSVIANSGKSYELINGSHTQIVNAQTISRLAGEQIRYFIYSNDGKVDLITDTLPNTTGTTVYVPAIRIQYAGR